MPTGQRLNYSLRGNGWYLMSGLVPIIPLSHLGRFFRVRGPATSPRLLRHHQHGVLRRGLDVPHRQVEVTSDVRDEGRTLNLLVDVHQDPRLLLGCGGAAGRRCKGSMQGGVLRRDWKGL